MSGEDGAPFPPINNYKGVMLCDRPSAADAGPQKPTPFTSAVVPPEQLGLNPCKKLNVHAVQTAGKGERWQALWHFSLARWRPYACASVGCRPHSIHYAA